MILFGRSITALFISTEVPALAAEAKHVAYCFLCVMSAFLPVLYLLYVYLSALQGMGYTGLTLVSGTIEFLIRLIIACFIGWCGYEMGIFSAEVIAWIGPFLYLMIHYRRKIQDFEQTIQT